MKPLKLVLLTVLILGYYFLHQDYWNWHQAHPLVLGFLPVGLAYHAAYSLGASVVLGLLVKFAWPKHLERLGEPENGGTAAASHRPEGQRRP